MSGNAILEGDGLGAQHLLGRHGEKCAGLHRGVVGDDHAQAPAHAAQPGDYARTGRTAIFAVHFIRGPKAQLEESGSFIEQQVQPFSYRQASLCVLCLSGLRSATKANQILLRPQLRQ